MRWLLIAAGALVTSVLIVAMVGYALPHDHVASRTARQGGRRADPPPNRMVLDRHEMAS